MPPKKIKNPETGRFVLRDGEVGKRILAQQGKAKQTTPKLNKKRESFSSEDDESEYEDSELNSSVNGTTDGESEAETENEGTDETSGSEQSSENETEAETGDESGDESQDYSVDDEEDDEKESPSPKRKTKNTRELCEEDVLLRASDVKDFSLSGQLVPVKRTKKSTSSRDAFDA